MTKNQTSRSIPLSEHPHEMPATSSSGSLIHQRIRILITIMLGTTALRLIIGFVGHRSSDRDRSSDGHRSKNPRPSSACVEQDRTCRRCGRPIVRAQRYPMEREMETCCYRCAMGQR